MLKLKSVRYWNSHGTTPDIFKLIEEGFNIQSSNTNYYTQTITHGVTSLGLGDPPKDKQTILSRNKTIIPEYCRVKSARNT